MESYDNSLDHARQFIEEHNDYLVISHVHPDGDATGSSLAMANLLNCLGKRYVVANDGQIPQKFSFLKGTKQIVNLSTTNLKQTFPTVIAVDVADRERMGDVSKVISDESIILNIDHHPTNTNFGHLNVIHSAAASTTEILFDLIETYYKEYMNQDIASALYTGLITDTGGFRYANTSAHVLKIGAELIKCGVKPSEIAEHTLEAISTSHLKILKQALQSLSLHYGEQVAFISVSLDDMQQTGATKDDLEGLVSYPRNIEGVEVGALFKEEKKGEVKVSLRSKYDVDVSVIAQQNGGGGHAKASGYTFRGTLLEARDQLMSELANYFGE